MALPNIIQQINSKLPLSGGTITGSITFLNNWGDNIGDIGGCISTNNNCLRLTGGEFAHDKAGGVIQLFNRQHTTYAGGVVIRADNGTTSREINLKSDGTFTWGGNNVITSAGGTMTGNINWDRGVVRQNGHSFEFVGDKDLPNQTSFIACRSATHPNESGWFYFGARNKESGYMGICKPDGTFTWGGSKVLTEANKTLITQWGLPNYSAIITGLAMTYTAPYNGVVLFNKDVGNDSGNVTVNGVTVYLGGNDASNEGNVTLFLKKGDTIVMSGCSAVGTKCFIPLYHGG